MRAETEKTTEFSAYLSSIRMTASGSIEYGQGSKIDTYPHPYKSWISLEIIRFRYNLSISIIHFENDCASHSVYFISIFRVEQPSYLENIFNFTFQNHCS